MGSYQDHMLDGASAVDLVVALYDGIIRFLYAALDAVDRGDQDSRRIAVKRALDILIHLQARLRMDIGGRSAQALSDSTHQFSPRSCRLPSRRHARNSTMRSIASATCEMRGNRLPRR